MGYDYCACEEDTSQYDDYDLGEHNIVPARYIHAKISDDARNRYIEALPLPRTKSEILMDYTKTLPEYSYEKIKGLSKLDKMLQIGTLRSIRFPLPFHESLEFDFYNSLLTSYRSRKRVKSMGASDNLTYTAGNDEKKSNSILTGDSSASTNAGFSLIGYSGCGKSSAIEVLVSHYPQVIIHEDEGGYFPQITYLVVNCVANSNFSALYQGIGDAIDKAFGNLTPVYAREIERTTGLGRKADKVKEYIEKFAIGIIIFDEIQLIDFEHTKENTFDSLLTLANRTKVAIAVIGTEDARDKMFRELRTARRIGTVINGNRYCEKKEFFDFLVCEVFRYQWFDKPVEVNDDIVDSLYDLTKGIVDQLISIYSSLNYDYLERKEKKEITGEYIRSVANKYYPGLQNILAGIGMDNESDAELRQMKENAEIRVNEILDKARQEQEAEQILSAVDKSAAMQTSLTNVTANITAIYDEYSSSKIEDAFHKVMKRKGAEEKSEKEITRLVLKVLQDGPKRRNKKEKIEPPDLAHMQSFLEIQPEDTK